MTKFNPTLYKKLFGEWNDPIILNHERDEVEIIKRIKNSKNKTFIDLGAGYGRMTPYLSREAKEVLLIDIDLKMIRVLKKLATKYSNTRVIKGDFTRLNTLLKSQRINKAVFLSFQNTLGTVIGDWKRALYEIKKAMDRYNGEVIISLYRKNALKDWGLMTYWHGKEMNGEPDMEKTNFKRGIFVSKTGYTSKWWSNKEIFEIKRFLGERLLNEKMEKEYWIFHIGT